MSHKLSPWFIGTKPVHIGIYQTRFWGSRGFGYSFWNGRLWGFEHNSLAEAETNRKKYPNSAGAQYKEWRGIVK